MRKIIVAAAAVQFASQSVAQAPAQPKLLVVIAVDQFSADLWDEYRPQFTAGFARLAQGSVFHNGYQSHATTETCPGHSTILTGDHPARTGIVSNNWLDQSIARADKSVYCAEDERVPGSDSSHYTVSATHLLVPTLGDLMKRRWPASRNVAVSGKDRAAVMMSGHSPDQRWYWQGTQFVTDNPRALTPRSVTMANRAIAAALAQPRPPLDPPPFCQSKAKPIALSGGKTVGAGRFERNAGDAGALTDSPEFDGDTLAVAAGLVDELQLGRGPSPDVLAIGLSATDHVGHAYGTEGQEMCLNLFDLDRELGDFFQLLDSRGIDYAVALTADHGGQDLPEREQLAGITAAARVDPALEAGTIGRRIVGQLGLGGFGLSGGTFGNIYVDRSLAPADRKRVLDAAMGAYRAHPQVEAVFTADQIAATPVPTGSPVGWTLLQRARASFYPGRSGDLFVVLKKYVTPISDPSHSVATHGSPWDYDRRVPVIFWRKGATPLSSDDPVETTDIMPTLASMIGLPVDRASIDGHCLAAVSGTACPAR